MNVSAKSEYGLRALAHLAGRADRLVPAREIARVCDVPVKYLEQILVVLRDAGLVEAQVGSAGGYRLARDARLMTAGDAIRRLDERLGLADCSAVTLRERASREPDAFARLWLEAEAGLLEALDARTIRDLARGISDGTGAARSAS